MPSVFTMIIQGDLPGTFVWRDELCVAFMSINPITRGHALVVPNAEIDHWLDAPVDLQQHLFEVARQIAQAQKRAFRTERIGLIIAGFEVPHMHIHVIPAQDMSDMNFANASSSVEESELQDAANAITEQLDQV
ncbi:MAG TPA: HIT family protein [Acidimicrobiales bacterium]|jgi:diadenosine tetraphosphate (Ap4A) HIT family hydrolase|nr:HIT family protein [Acidimicrobiales bacterium]